MGYEYSRPKLSKEDVLFASDSALWQMEAILDYRPGNDYPYREGYRRAGRILTEWIEEHRTGQDFLVFPICHAYRHFVELSLKRLVRLGCSVVAREMTEKESKLQSAAHNLKELWMAFEAISHEVDKETGSDSASHDDIDAIKAYIDQLHAVDAGSFTFRYPLTKTGEVSVGDIDRINLARFCEYMEGLCEYIEGYDAYYGYLIDVRTDMRSD